MYRHAIPQHIDRPLLLLAYSIGSCGWSTRTLIGCCAVVLAQFFRWNWCFLQQQHPKAIFAACRNSAWRRRNFSPPASLLRRLIYWRFTREQKKWALCYLRRKRRARLTVLGPVFSPPSAECKVVLFLGTFFNNRVLVKIRYTRPRLGQNQWLTGKDNKTHAKSQVIGQTNTVPEFGSKWPGYTCLCLSCLAFNWFWAILDQSNSPYILLLLCVCVCGH